MIATDSNILDGMSLDFSAMAFVVILKRTRSVSESGARSCPNTGNSARYEKVSNACLFARAGSLLRLRIPSSQLN